MTLEMAPSRRRTLSLAALVLPLSLLGCASGDGGQAKATPEQATSASQPSKGSALASVMASALAPPPVADAPVAPSAEPSAAAEAPGSASASGSARASASAAPSGAASATASKAAAIPLPAAPRGILPDGGADRIVKTGDKPLIKLLEPGDEPRDKASYAFVKGETKMEIAIDMAVQASANGQKMPTSAMPRLTMLMQLAAGEKVGDGDMPVDAKLLKLGVEAENAEQRQVAAALKPQLDTVKGLAMSYQVSSQGYVHDLKMDTKQFGDGAPQIVAGMTQSLESMLAKLPRDAIGLGARWQVVSRIASAGADLLQYETFTLKKRDGSKLGLEVSVTQLAATASVGGGALPAGASAKITSFRSVGTGESEVDTKRVAVSAGVLKMNTAMDLSVAQQGQPPADSRVDTHMTVHFRKPK